MVSDVSVTRRPSTTGLRRYLDLQQQRDWLQGRTTLRDADERSESLELRLKYVARFEKSLATAAGARGAGDSPALRPRLHPDPRLTERHYWSVSCLPSTPGKALVRVNASWMELFSLYADGEGIRALFLVHLSDFTTDHSLDQRQVDEAFLERCVMTPEDVGYLFPRGEDIFGIKVRGFSSIGKFLAARRALRAIRAFNLTHINSGPERLSGEATATAWRIIC